MWMFALFFMNQYEHESERNILAGFFVLSAVLLVRTVFICVCFSKYVHLLCVSVYMCVCVCMCACVCACVPHVCVSLCVCIHACLCALVCVPWRTCKHHRFNPCVHVSTVFQCCGLIPEPTDIESVLPHISMFSAFCWFCLEWLVTQGCRNSCFVALATLKVPTHK